MQAETQAKIESITATIELLRVHVGYEVAMARLAELEIELKLLQLQHERLRAQTELLYLEGEYDA